MATYNESSNWTLEIFVKKMGRESSSNWETIVNEKIVKSESYQDKPKKDSFVGVKLKKPITVECERKIGLHFYSTPNSRLALCDLKNHPEYVQNQGKYLVLTNSLLTGTRLKDQCGSDYIDYFVPVICFDFLVHLK